MIASKTVAEIRRLLTEEKLSQRRVAKLTGISRGTIGAIASGRRPDYDTLPPGAGEVEEDPCGPPERCSGCGGLVYMPCRLCRQRARMARLARPTPPVVADLRGLAGLDLKPEHRARYDEVRAWRRAHQGRPLEGRTAS